MWAPLLLLLPLVTAELYLPSIVSNSGVTKVLGHGLAAKVAKKALTEVTGEGHVVTAYTWGIGGPRVGRPSHSQPTPAMPVEGIAPGDAVVDVSLSGHTALVTASGVLYTCGRNDSAGGGGHGSPPISDAGQLGRMGPANQLLPVHGELEGKQAVASACGRYHTAGLTADGGVYTFGLNDYGQLGRRGVMGAAGSNKCICDSGGDCSCGQQGGPVVVREGEACHGGASCRSGIPTRVALPGPAVALAAGRYTTVAVMGSGELYAWGLNLCASDGEDLLPADLVRDSTRAATPRRVRGFGGPGEPKAVKADVGYIHMAILTEAGDVWTCHTGYDGYAGGLQHREKPNAQGELGRPTLADAHAYRPGLVAGALEGQRVVDIATGRCHTLTVTEAGKVVSFGCNILGRSGGKEPGEVGGLLAGESAAGVAAGEHFSLVVVQSGRVFGWGDGGSGQMGFKTERTHTPISVPLHPLGRPHDTDGVHALRVVAGYQHAAALVVETNAR